MTHKTLDTTSILSLFIEQKLICSYIKAVTELDVPEIPFHLLLSNTF